MKEFFDILAMLVAALSLVALLYATHRFTAVAAAPLRASPFMSGHRPNEHAVSRFHARWYPLTLLFLAFDVEMLFMYPWAVIVAAVGMKAIVEMFIFLGLLMAGVVYAWREGALRWT